MDPFFHSVPTVGHWAVHSNRSDGRVRTYELLSLVEGLGSTCQPLPFSRGNGSCNSLMRIPCSWCWGGVRDRRLLGACTKHMSRKAEGNRKRECQKHQSKGYQIM